MHTRAFHAQSGVGTYRYMAPEVVRYEQYTASQLQCFLVPLLYLLASTSCTYFVAEDKIDIFAFALMMYYIAAGFDHGGALA